MPSVRKFSRRFRAMENGQRASASLLRKNTIKSLTSMPKGDRQASLDPSGNRLTVRNRHRCGSPDLVIDFRHKKTIFCAFRY